MPKCRNCVHWEACREYVTGLAAARGVDLDATELEQIFDSDDCGHFHDSSRFVELPCKVGDYLYRPHRNQISKYAVKCLEVGYANIVFVNWEIIEGVAYPLHGIHGDEIGKTVFLTREAAEQALKERES